MENTAKPIPREPGKLFTGNSKSEIPNIGPLVESHIVVTVPLYRYVEYSIPTPPTPQTFLNAKASKAEFMSLNLTPRTAKACAEHVRSGS